MDTNNNLSLKVFDIFNDISPDYVSGLCTDKVDSIENLDAIINHILNTNGEYPKRALVASDIIDPHRSENILNLLTEVLSDADPNFLAEECRKHADNESNNWYQEFINTCLESGNYPTLLDAKKRQEVFAQIQQYTSNFNVENFVKLFPDPNTYFSAQRNHLVPKDELSITYCIQFLAKMFPNISLRSIRSIFSKCNQQTYQAVQVLKANKLEAVTFLQRQRRPSIVAPTDNIPLLQLLAYIEHESKILQFIRARESKRVKNFEVCKTMGLLMECICCYDSEVLFDETVQCPKGCTFCVSCVIMSCEIAYGEGQVHFPCLASCPVEFPLSTLQKVLPPKLFAKIAIKRAAAEVQAADIQGLEFCPFCDFATIPVETDRIFKCLNEECMKESCRLCHEPNHIPYTCDEYENTNDVKIRVAIEDKLTAALIRQCDKCGSKFIKFGGCNKVTCKCGQCFCYICGANVTIISYKHFNGQGGDRHDLCPLYSDTLKLDQDRVLNEAIKVKLEFGTANLKVDPTAGLSDHFNAERQKFIQK